MKTQMALEIGLGTDLRGEDCTKAACRAVKDALHRNSLTMAPALGFPREAMLFGAHTDFEGHLGFHRSVTCSVSL